MPKATCRVAFDIASIDLAKLLRTTAVHEDFVDILKVIRPFLDSVAQRD